MIVDTCWLKNTLQVDVINRGFWVEWIVAAGRQWHIEDIQERQTIGVGEHPVVSLWKGRPICMDFAGVMAGDEELLARGVLY